MSDKPAVNLPSSADETASTIIGDKIVFVTIDYDQDANNPCEDCDGFGMIRSLSHRHINSIDWDEAIELLETDEDVIPLSYFEHGNSLWMVQNSPAPAGVEFQWDGVRFAGVWIPDKCVRESYMGQDGLTRREWMVKQAESACETYTQWANGDVYGYTVQVYALRHDAEDSEIELDELSDYRHAEPLADDSCWGFYGWDSVTDEATNAAQSAIE